MLAAGFTMAAIAAIFSLSAFLLFILLVPILVAGYYQRRHNLRFGKPQRKRIAAWYIGMNSLIGLIPLSTAVYEIQDELQEPFLAVLAAAVFVVIVYVAVGYLMVYWVLGWDFAAKR